MKTPFFVLLTVLSTLPLSSAHARCRPGDSATIIWAGEEYRKPYDFKSYRDGSNRVLPVGTRVTIITAVYSTFSSMTYLTGVDLSVSGRPRSLLDPTTSEVLTCEPVEKESGAMQAPSAGYFGMKFLSCQ